MKKWKSLKGMGAWYVFSLNGHIPLIGHRVPATALKVYSQNPDHILHIHVHMPDPDKSPDSFVNSSNRL